MLDCLVTHITKRNKVREIIRQLIGFVLAHDIPKGAKRLNVVNIQFTPRLFLGYAAVLTAAFVTLACCIALFGPIGAVVFFVATFPVVVIRSAPISGMQYPDTSGATARLMVDMQFIWLAADDLTTHRAWYVLATAGTLLAAFVTTIQPLPFALCKTLSYFKRRAAGLAHACNALLLRFAATCSTAIDHIPALARVALNQHATHRTWSGRQLWRARYLGAACHAAIIPCLPDPTWLYEYLFLANRACNNRHSNLRYLYLYYSTFAASDQAFYRIGRR
jgi:hypothetical protein